MVKSPSIVIQLDPITIPVGLEPLVNYFDATYISGTYRKVQRPPGPDGTVPPIRVRMTPPPDLWNVNIQTMSGGSRTNNLCETWKRGFCSLVGTSLPTIWKALEHIRLDHHNVKTEIFLEARSQPLGSEYEKSPNNYKIDSSICASHTLMTRNHLKNAEGHWTQLEM